MIPRKIGMLASKNNGCLCGQLDVEVGLQIQTNPKVSSSNLGVFQI